MSEEETAEVHVDGDTVFALVALLACLVIMVATIAVLIGKLGVIFLLAYWGSKIASGRLAQWRITQTIQHTPSGEE